MNICKITDIIKKDSTIHEMLKSCPYEILKQWEICRYQEKDIIFRQGEVHNYFYIITEGYADIYILAENGKKYTQAIYTKGNYIGELEIFDKLPSASYVAALSDSVLIRLKREYFLRWLELDININNYLAKTLSRLFYKLSIKAANDTLYPLTYRLCKYLLDCIDRRDKGNEYIKIYVNKEQISEQLAVTKRSVNRVLKNLKDKKIIDMGDNYIIIKDLKKFLREQELSKYQ